MTTTKRSYFDLLDERDRIDSAIRFCRVAMMLCKKHDMKLAYVAMGEKLAECQADRAEVTAQLRKRANVIKRKWHKARSKTAALHYCDVYDTFSYY